MQIRYYIGPEHHKAHINYIYKLLGGEMYVSGKRLGNSYEEIEHLDTKDTIWFFLDIYSDIHSKIKGKSIYVNHGIGFKPRLEGNKSRSEIFDKYFSQIWVSCPNYQQEFFRSGITFRKLKPIGATYYFDIPRLDVIENTMLVSAGWFEELIQVNKIYRLLENTSEKIKIWVTCHPSMPDKEQSKFKNLCETRKNLTFITTQEELMKAYAFCECALVGLSSVSAPFFYLKKPVVFMKDKNRFPFFQWTRLRSRIKNPVFFNVLRDSYKLLDPLKISRIDLQKAKYATSSKKMFFETNWDEAVTIDLVKKTIKELY